MAIALKLNTTTGGLNRFAAADTLDIDQIEPRSGGNLVIGSTLGAGDEVRLGAVGETVRVLGDLTVDGSETVSTNETVTGTFTANGTVNLGDNSGDTINLGGGTTDTVNLNSDLVVGAGTLTIGSSVTDYLADLWLGQVNTNGPNNAAYDLNASGTNAGAYAIGVDASLLANSTATDLMTALDDLDAAISAGGGETLQQTYALGNTIDVTSANGAVDLSNTTDADTTTVLVVNKSPATSATAGLALSVVAGANSTGTALQINNSGTGNALDVQDAGTSVLAVTGVGRVEVDPTSGQDFEVITGGAGNINLNSAANVDIDGSSVTIDSTGAVSIDGASGSNFSTSAGNLTLDAAAGELIFDDTGNSGLTLSQAADRTLDQTASGEILNGATSVIGAINRIARAIDADGRGAIEEVAIENAVTITAGDVVAQSTTSGRVTQFNGNNDTNSRFIGTALTGGTGDAGGTVLARVAYPGNKITDSGAAFTAGNALFGPDGTGRPVQTAPSGTGDAVKRIGWAHTSTEYVIDPGPTVIL